MLPVAQGERLYVVAIAATCSDCNGSEQQGARNEIMRLQFQCSRATLQTYTHTHTERHANAII